MNRQKVRSLCIKNPGISGEKRTFLISFPQEASSHRVDGSIVQYGWFCVGLHHSTPPNSIWARRYSSSKSIGWFKFQISQCNPIGSITWNVMNFIEFSHIWPSRLSLTRCISELRWSLEECYGANQLRIIQSEEGAGTLTGEMKSKKLFSLY